MSDLSNYYQQDPRSNEAIGSERFPNNHIQFSAILKPLQWLDNVYRIFGSHMFMTKHAILKEFDAAAPLDDCLGSQEELKEVRKLIVSYCEGIDNNQFLSTIGRFLLKTISLNTLKNRRNVLQFYHSNKDFIVANGNFKAPVIITGSPRSGTTLLQRLMSEDPNTRSPYTFELEIPTPPMSSGVNPLEDPRIKRSGAAISSLSKLAPGFMEKFAESHYWSPIEMEASLVYMLAHNCINVMNNATAGRGYMDDFFKIEAIWPIFRYERLFFTMLDAYRPVQSHWTLKAPIYAPFFSNIFDEYPDARVILTHRNPIYTFPSVCRTMESWHIAFDKDGSFDKHRFAEFQQVYMEKYILVPLKYRNEHPEKEKQIFDCKYEELFSNPIEMVKRIYQKYELEYSEEFEERMKNYLRNNKQGKYGRHKYSLEEYGFTGKGLYQKYKAYMDHYGYGIPDKIERPVFFNYSV